MINRNHHADKDQRYGRKFGNPLQTSRAVGEVKAEHGVDVRQNHADNLAEAEGDDRQIVAAQAKRRNADDDAEDTGDDGADDDCGKDVRNERRVITLFQERSGRRCFHEDTACISADRHEACVPQRELPQIAGCDVQGNRQNDVDTDGD